MEAEPGLRQLLRRMEIGGDAARRLFAYLALLEKWNPRVNLTASLEWEAIGPLFHEGLWSAGLCHKERMRHLDIGSGAGFPAIPIAALHPDRQFDLVESRSRRAVFLEVVARELELPRVRVVDRRLGEYLAADPGAGGWQSISWKGVKLSRADIGQLVERAPGASFWLFHSACLPVQDPAAWTATMFLERCAAFPGKSGSYVSMFHVKQ